jgi:hypothetical protein
MYKLNELLQPTDDITTFPVSKFIPHYSSYRSWEGSRAYISRHPCLWSSLNGYHKNKNVPIINNPNEETLLIIWAKFGNLFEPQNCVTEVSVTLPYSSTIPLYQLPYASKVTEKEAMAIYRLIQRHEIPDQIRPHVWAHISGGWEYIQSNGQNEFDRSQMYSDYFKKVSV